MKKKFIMFVVRIIRLLGKEGQLVPELRWCDSVLPGRVYRHFGRILLAHRNRETFSVRYFRRSSLSADSDPDAAVESVEISREEYYRRFEDGEASSLRMEMKGSPCAKCACEQLNIPCYCRFRGGERTGWFELINNPRQYSDNVKY
jgi:hypothetical protein